jgi:trehalose 6-phosphate phosphatase
MDDRAPPASRDWCLFLDVDGTLLDISDTPSDVHVDDRLKALLMRVSECLHGALALVSGRSIASIDALFAPIRFPAAGLHGVERRTASGEIQGADFSDPRLDHARTLFALFVASHPGTLLEDKGRSLAVHFRLAPAAEERARATVKAEAETLGAAFHVQEGKMVLELKPRGFSKGTAVAEFMREAPFANRTPVFAGDDLTDEAGLRAVEKLGGISIAVGGRIAGAWCMQNPAVLRRWLESIAALDGG